MREARVRAGKTQAEVAGGIVSPAFLSMVESGRREASPDVLARLAERLDIDLSIRSDADLVAALVVIRTGLARAQVAVETGDFEGAIRELDVIDRRFAGGTERDLRAEFHYWRGRAQEGLGQIESAIRELSTAVEIAEQRGSVFREVEIGVDLVRCLRMHGDLSAALDRANHLQGRVPPAMEGSPLHGKLVSTVIELHVARGDQTMAQVLADRAGVVFGEGADPNAKALELWGASLAAEADGDGPGALLLAAEGVRLMAGSVDAARMGRLHAALAWLFLRVTPPDLEGAEERLETARRAFGQRIGPLDAAMLQAESARLRWLRSDLEGARAEALAALTAFDARPDSVLAADPHLIAARAEAGLGNMEASRMHFQAAQAILSAAEPSRVTSVAWRELGDVYLGLGHGEDAVRAYQQALTDVGLRSAAVGAARGNGVANEGTVPTQQ